MNGGTLSLIQVVDVVSIIAIGEVERTRVDAVLGGHQLADRDIVLQHHAFDGVVVAVLGGVVEEHPPVHAVILHVRIDIVVESLFEELREPVVPANHDVVDTLVGHRRNLLDAFLSAVRERLHVANVPVVAGQPECRYEDVQLVVGVRTGHATAGLGCFC